MKRSSSFFEKTKTFLCFAGPSLLIFSLVVVIPIFYGIYLTFTDWDGIASTKNFVWFENYIALFQDEAFWASLWMTIKYVFLSVILINLLAFFLAYGLTSGVRGQNFLRAGFFTPNLIGGVILGFIWQFIFSRVTVQLYEYIPVSLLERSWLSSPEMAFAALVIVTVWQYAGYMLLIYISGFVSIPSDLIEAASIDGASEAQIMRRIRLPLMVPSFVICLFLSITRCFKVYDLNISLTEGGPYNSTKLVAMHIYTKAFEEHRYGVGQAEAIVLFLIMAAIALTQVYIGKKMEVEA